jgi:hypothetical protein
MSIRDRDYMKRRSDDYDERSSTKECRAEEFAQRVLARSRRLFLIGGIVLAVLIVVALILSRFSGSSH